MSCSFLLSTHLKLRSMLGNTEFESPFLMALYFVNVWKPSDDCMVPTAHDLQLVVDDGQLFGRDSKTHLSLD